MTTDPHNPQSRESEALEADARIALDVLFTEARMLMQDMKRFLRQQHEQDSK